MSASRIIVVLSILLVFGSSLFVLGAFGSNEENMALSAIGKAELAMGLAYEAVLEAERAGADVSGLLNKLNDGAEALSNAHMSYRVGDFDGAIYFANLSYDLVWGTEAESNKLRDVAAVERKQRLILTPLGSVFAVSCIFCGGFFGWRFFKRRYYRQVLKMKPEVASNES